MQNYCTAGSLQLANSLFPTCGNEFTKFSPKLGKFYVLLLFKLLRLSQLHKIYSIDLNVPESDKHGITLMENTSTIHDDAFYLYMSLFCNDDISKSQH